MAEETGFEPAYDIMSLLRREVPIQLDYSSIYHILKIGASTRCRAGSFGLQPNAFNQLSYRGL